jgi:GWxTD domain-containing protein
MRDAAMAATGGNLVKRIRRLLAPPEGPRMTIAPILPVGILLITGAIAMAAWETPAPQGPAAVVPSAWAHPLLVAQAQTAPAAPPAASPYDKWLHEEAVYIITDQERADFRKLQTDAEREHFVEEFWKRRDPTPGTPRNEYKEEHYRRIAYANDRFKSAIPGWKTDRGRIYIEYGPPDEIDSHPSGGAYRTPSNVQTVTYPFEQWRYKFIEGVGTNVILEFVDTEKTGEFRLTMDPTEKEIRHPNQQELMEQAEALKRALSPDELKRQLDIAARQLRDLEDTVPPGQIDLLESQAQVEHAQKQLEKWAEHMRDLEGRLPPAQSDLLESQVQTAQAEKLTRELNLRVLSEQLRAAGELPPSPEQPETGNGISLFGSGSQVMVAVLPNRSLLVTIPFDFPAEQYRIYVSTVSADGKTVWSDHAEANRGDTNSLTLAAPTLAPGSYQLRAGVKDPDSSKQKTYVVNFSVK